MKQFTNEPLTDFSREANRKKQLAAIEKCNASLGRKYENWVGGVVTYCDQTFTSINPSDPSEVVGVFPKADEAAAGRALDAALAAFDSWKSVTPEERSRFLFKAADLMKERRFDLNASMIIEAGKSWIEADADTAEAIDFLIFYAREAIRYGTEHPITPLEGQKPELRYIPLGVGIVIPPWNFPLAILAGMSSAAIVSGNTIVLKPSSDTPAVGWEFMDIMRAVGLPPGVLNFITGPGAVGGDFLVRHPKTRFISFTGSKDVGLGIVQKAGAKADGQIWIKRVVAEMGGKDAIIVDLDADLDAAADGITASAFGLQGQKCSACSRAIIAREVYDEMIEKLKTRVEALNIGDTRDYDNTMGPVINEHAMKSILNYIETGRKEGVLVTGGDKVGGNGFFLAPTIIKDVRPGAVVEQEEIFGPVLVVIESKDFDESLRIANGTEYGLTGAVYSANRNKLEQAKEEFHVGNLYLNRKCTGALVGVHPFGGFNMSGTDSKAGGRDYLLLFQQAKSICEKIQ